MLVVCTILIGTFCTSGEAFTVLLYHLFIPVKLSMDTFAYQAISVALQCVSWAKQFSVSLFALGIHLNTVVFASPTNFQFEYARFFH